MVSTCQNNSHIPFSNPWGRGGLGWVSLPLYTQAERGSEVLEKRLRAWTLEPDCLDLNASSATFQLCNLGQLPDSPWRLCVLICKMGNYCACLAPRHRSSMVLAHLGPS